MSVDVDDPRTVDLTDPWFRDRAPREWLARLDALRDLDALAFLPQRRYPLLPRPGRGYHALVRHADVVEASRRADLFTSAPSAVVPQIPTWMHRYVGAMMIDMDDPEHARIRRVISRSFTPRRLALIEQDVRTAAEEIVAAAAAGPCRDFVTEVAAPLPVRVICDMMGVPETERDRVLLNTNRMTGLFDPEYGGIPADAGPLRTARAIRTAVGATRELYRLGMRLAAARRGRPADDLVTALVSANPDGERLTPRELGSFFILVLTAGNETTRNAITSGLKLLTDHPDQRAALTADFPGRVQGAVEEILRWASPIINFRRTVARDCELNGHPVRAGDRVVLFYVSANRDAAVFDRPGDLDITRSPNDHVAFGGPGPHYCLGAHLARLEMRVLFEELFTRLPAIRAREPLAPLVSPLIQGIKHIAYTH